MFLAFVLLVSEEENVFSSQPFPKDIPSKTETKYIYIKMLSDTGRTTLSVHTFCPPPVRCHGCFLNCVTFHDLYWGHWWEQCHVSNGCPFGAQKLVPPVSQPFSLRSLASGKVKLGFVVFPKDHWKYLHCGKTIHLRMVMVWNRLKELKRIRHVRQPGSGPCHRM